MATNRTISTVTNYVNSEGKPRVKVTLEGGQVVGLRDLSRPEIQAAARVKYPAADSGIPGNVWMRLGNESIATAIRADDVDVARQIVADGNGKLQGKGKTPAPEGTPAPPAPVESDDAVATALATLKDAFSRPAVDADALAATITTDILGRIDSRLREMDYVPIRVTVQTAEQVRDLPTHHHNLLPEIVQVLGAGVNVFLSGPAGTGKSTIVKHAADALGRAFFEFGCNPGMTDFRLFGGELPNGKVTKSAVAEWYATPGAVLCIDEADNAHPAMATGLNGLLESTEYRFPWGEVVKRGEGNVAVLTANTWGLGATAEYVGRTPMDGAFKNRFPVQYYVDYDAKMERHAALAYANDDNHSTISEWIDTVQRVRRNAQKDRVKVLFTPRNVIAGAKLISAAGWSIDKALDRSPLVELESDQRKRLLAA